VARNIESKLTGPPIASPEISALLPLAGCAANLNAQQMRWLLDYASQEASGIAAWQRDTDHIEKGFVFAGGPARNGVTAALLVQSGLDRRGTMSSPALTIFSWPISIRPIPVEMIEKLGERYEIARTNIKKWTVGSPIQAPLDAPRKPTQEASVSARDQVQTVNVAGRH